MALDRVLALGLMAALLLMYWLWIEIYGNVLERNGGWM